jgi:tryptophan 2,3-dioxygenase
MTWEIAVGVFTMASAVLAIVNAAVKVNRTLTSLEAAVNQLREAIEKQSGKNSYFYRKLEEHEREIADIRTFSSCEEKGAKRIV